ncbi:MAG: glycosyl hydrolase family 28-related protein [Acidobacteriota bacterium]
MASRMIGIWVGVVVAGFIAEAATVPSGGPAQALERSSGAGFANVREAPYLAVGDGRSDDTQAFQKALDDVSAAGGGIVHVPTGNYLIKTHLSVPPGTSLVGVGRAPMTHSPESPGSRLLAVEGAGSTEETAFLTLVGPNSTIEGITVFYPNQVIAERPVPYPWTVRGGGGPNVSIINVLLVNPYQAVDFATNQSPRHYVRGLYGQPLWKGIWVDQCYDIGRIQDVHFWPFWTTDKPIVDFTTTKGTTFIFQRTDWEVVEDIFCWGYQVGIEFSASKDGAMNGQLTDINLDNVDIGIDVRATQPFAVHVSNLNIANAGAGTNHVAIWGRKGSERAELSVRGASFWGFLKQILRWENPGTVSLSDSRLIPWHTQQPMVEILAGRAFLHDNLLQRYRQGRIEGKWSLQPVTAGKDAVGIRVGPDAENAMVHGNQLTGNAIVNEAKQRALLANNQP